VDAVLLLLADPGLRLHPFALAAAYTKKLPFLQKVGVGTHRLEMDGHFEFAVCSAAYDGIVADRLVAAGVPDLRHARADFVGIDGVFYATRPWGIDAAPERLADMIAPHCGSAANFPDIGARELVQAQSANATYVHAILTR